MAAKSFFDLGSNSMDGQRVPMATFSGRVCLVVNVASA